MMQLGLTGSIKTDDSVLAFKKGKGDVSASKNENKANDFAKALDNDQQTKSSENGRAMDAQAKLNDSDQYSDSAPGGSTKNSEEVGLVGSGEGSIDDETLSGLKGVVSDLEGTQSSTNASNKQIAFVTIDSALAEKLAPVNVANSNKNESVGVDINGTRKTIIDTTEKLVLNTPVVENDKKNNQVVSKTLSEAKTSTASAETMTGKIAFKELSNTDNKNQKNLPNRASSIAETKLDLKSVDAGNIETKNVTKAGFEINPKISTKVDVVANENLKDDTLSKLSDKTLPNNSKAALEQLQSSTVSVKGKPSSNGMNFVNETKLENLGNALQQLIVTSEGKSDTQVQSVSAPRIVLPESQSVVPQKTIEIQLLPKTLGLIQVKIEISDGKMTLMIEAQTAKAEAALKQEVVQIIDTIKAAGLSVEEISVRRNAELSQQDEAINDFSAEDNTQEKLANGTFDDHFEGQKDQNNNDLLGRDDAEIDISSNNKDTRTGIYL